MSLNNCTPTGGTSTVYKCIAGELWRYDYEEFECDGGQIVWKVTNKENTERSCDPSNFPE